MSFHLAAVYRTQSEWDLTLWSSRSCSACRLGIASKLVRRCEALARADGRVDAMALHVEPTNAPACKLYESLGYAAVRLGDASPWSCLIGVADTGASLQVMVKPLRDVELTDGSKRR